MSSPGAALNFMLLLVSLLVLGAALLVGAMVGQEQGILVVAALLAAIGGFVFLALGSRYWLLIPFGLTAQLPAIPLGGRAVESGELIVAVCFAFFLARIALKRESLRILHPVNVPILLFLGWVGMIFAINLKTAVEVFKLRG